jgi:KaiC/GvpD/RAD55 family RecA-like ATPase
MNSTSGYTLSSEETIQVDRVPTGVQGLDYMLGGGLPSSRCVLVCGGPGSGKTIFGVQFLYNGVTKYGETGLYITLDESPAKLKRDMAGFGWNLERLEKDGKLVIVDASPIRTLPARVKVGNFNIRRKDFSMLSLNHIIKTKAQEIHAKRLVIDPITMFVLQYPDVSERRNAIVDLFEGLAKLGTTSLLMTELRASILEREIQPEEFLSDGVIVFHNFVNGGRVVRAVQIEKMRGIRHDYELRPYKILKDGIEVFPEENIYK